MRRYLSKLVLFLIFGTIVNVAVAWGCAIWLPVFTWDVPYERSSVTDDHVPYWYVEQLQRNGAIRYVWRYNLDSDFENAPGTDLGLTIKIVPVDLDRLPRWCRLDYSKPPPLNKIILYPIFIDDARGWPLLAMASFSTLGFHLEKEELLVKNADGFSLPESLISQPLLLDIEEEWYNHPILPLRPIWPGFAINTIFYAAFLWLLTLGPFTARRVIRRKRGLCSKCGYDLRGTSESGCPECGWQRDDGDNNMH